MSSSPLTSSEKAANAEEIHGDEELESLDESLDAILSEAIGVPTGELPATSTSPHEPPPAEVHVAMGLPAIEALGDDSETPLPVIVDELPSYQAFADEVAPAVEETTAQTATQTATEEAKVEEPAPELAAAPAEEKEDEIVDAESLVESMTPAPVVEPDREALLVTEESAAFVLSPPTDEQILENVVLPPGATPMPMPLSTSALERPPGAELEDDHTVISPNPPQPEPSLPVPVFRSAWSQTAPMMAEPLPEPTMPMLLTRSEGLGDKLLKVASSRVQASVAQLAIVVIAASALGGAVMKLASHPQPGLRPAALAASVEGPKAEAPAAAATAAAPAPAATPEPTATAPAVAEKPAEKPAAAHPTAVHAKAKSAPAQTHIALAAPPSKTNAAVKHAPAPAPAAKAKKPAAGHGAAQGSGWVDPFGQ